MSRRLFIIACLLVLLMPTAHAQDTDTWRITLFNPETATVNYLTPDGMERGIQFTEMLKLEYDQFVKAQVSPDGRYLAFQTYGWSDGDSMQTYLADLVTTECCKLLTMPDMTMSFLGPFSPDGTQIAVMLTNQDLLFANPNEASGRMVVFALATGIPVTQMPISKLEQPGAIALMGAWQDDGIRLISSCWACEGIWEGMYQIWNPQAGTLSQPVEPFDIFKSVLPATGELISATANLNYPESGIPETYWPPANVVEYYANWGQIIGNVIYDDPTNHYIHNAAWVLDGNAVLVIQARSLENIPDQFPIVEGATSYLLLRDGSRIELDLDGVFFPIGTPDGWVAETDEGYIHYKVEGTNIASTMLTTETEQIVIDTNFVLGETASGAFPIVPPPEKTVCPSFLPSRLAVNSIGRVTPGDPNNFRAQPTTSSESIGRIPGGAMFVALEGPVCAEGMAWWKVDYNGQVGWTVEGQGVEYWLEPVPSGG